MTNVSVNRNHVINSQVVGALKKEMKDKEILPVVAAGAISDGRELVAALALGASGVAIGTRVFSMKRKRRI
jgi:NAD(P)H-dependent flavin oxidoreductase YrpB (nitropropane dioxygenase family)